MNVKIFRNYGTLGAEKRSLYRITRGEISDELTVEIPENLHPYITRDEAVAIEPTPEHCYLLQEVLCGDEFPHIKYYDGKNNEIIMLKIIEEV